MWRFVIPTSLDARWNRPEATLLMSAWWNLIAAASL
jgi:hypothetical protein